MEWLKISTSTELVRIQTDDIVFVQADGNYSNIYLYNGSSRMMTFQLHYFEETFQKLRDNHFMRVGRRLIVNTNYIYSINLTTQELFLAGSQLQVTFKLNASREALNELKEKLDKEV